MKKLDQKTLKQSIDDELSSARQYLQRCVENITDAQSRVERLERLSRDWSQEKETLVADLMLAGVLEEPRPF